MQIEDRRRRHDFLATRYERQSGLARGLYATTGDVHWLREEDRLAALAAWHDEQWALAVELAA